MELWIRSQDKRILQKVDNIFLNANYENRRIYTIDINDIETELGEYKTKERALEVLDEIQECLSLKLKSSGSYQDMDILIKMEMIKGLYGYIYIMPKE